MILEGFIRDYAPACRFLPAKGEPANRRHRALLRFQPLRAWLPALRQLPSAQDAQVTTTTTKLWFRYPVSAGGWLDDGEHTIKVASAWAAARMNARNT
jgi:hypothetical protein